MADHNTSLYNQQVGRSSTLNYNPNASLQQATIKCFAVPYVVDGTEASTEHLLLGFPKIPGMVVVPELSRVVCPSGAGSAMVMTLQQVPVTSGVAGTPVALTAAATQVAANAVAFARPATTPTVAEVGVNDYLQVLLGTVTTKTAGVTVLFEIAYYSNKPSV